MIAQVMGGGTRGTGIDADHPVKVGSTSETSSRLRSQHSDCSRPCGKPRRAASGSCWTSSCTTLFCR
jgi:hypothetical protein